MSKYQRFLGKWRVIENEEEDIITITSGTNKLFIGMAKSQLIKFNFHKMFIEKKLDLLGNSSKKKVVGKLYTPEIVAMTFTKKEGRAVAGMSNSTCYVVDSRTMNIVSFLESKVNEPIVSIHVSEIENVIWVCH